MKRVVIAPHCDDETLGCGGLLAKFPTECGVVVLAQPDDVRRKEFEEARHVLGYKHTEFLNLRDGYVGADMHALVGALDGVLGRLRPDEMYLPFPSMHQDHIAAYEGGVRASRLSMSQGHHFTPSVFVYDVAAYDLDLYPNDLKWNVFESLDLAHVEKKMEALCCYSSQAITGPHPINSTLQQAQTLGAGRQLPFAERFALIREVRP